MKSFLLVARKKIKFIFLVGFVSEDNRIQNRLRVNHKSKTCSLQMLWNCNSERPEILSLDMSRGGGRLSESIMEGNVFSTTATEIMYLSPGIPLMPETSTWWFFSIQKLQIAQNCISHRSAAGILGVSLLFNINMPF